jgi:hypothetical protein
VSEKIHDDCHIVMSKFGIERMTKRPGNLKRGEIAVRVRLRVPASAFTDPDVSAEIDVPESAIIHPRVEVTVEDTPTNA